MPNAYMRTTAYVGSMACDRDIAPWAPTVMAAGSILLPPDDLLAGYVARGMLRPLTLADPTAATISARLADLEMACQVIGWDD